MKLMHRPSVSLSQCKRARSATSSLMNYMFMIFSQNSLSLPYSTKNEKTTCVSYGGLQSAYIKNCGLVVESYQMMERDHSFFFFPWDDLLREYTKKKWLIEARQLFDRMPNRSTVSWHTMIQGYIKIGNMKEARKLFESSPKAGTVWESMICGYARRHGMSKLAIQMFNRRLKNTFFTSQMLIAGYFTCDDWEAGQDEATSVPRDNNTATWNLLLEGNIYLGLMSEVETYFKELEEYNVNRNVLTWNSMIAMLKCNQYEECLTTKCFLKMPPRLRNSHSWNLLMAVHVTRGGICDEQMIETVVSVFLHMPERHQNVASWNTLIYVYLRTGMIHKARLCFDTMPKKNPHSWGLMIAGYLGNGMVDEAKKIFFDKRIRVDDDLHSLILILDWFVRNKRMDDARQFIINNVPKRPLSFYSVARACVKHGLVEGYKLVLETMQSTMGTNLDTHQTVTFMEEKLKEKRGPITLVHFNQRMMERTIARLEAAGDLSNPTYVKHASRTKEQSRPMFEYEIHSHSQVFMQILDSEVVANGDMSEIFLKGEWDCCGAMQV